MGRLLFSTKLTGVFTCSSGIHRGSSPHTGVRARRSGRVSLASRPKKFEAAILIMREVEKTELPKFCTKYECNTQYVYGARVLIDEASVALL